jgi:BirA family biotin operon repressor/biotin-[acetyl-CoA-carboxylase] ligase
LIDLPADFFIRHAREEVSSTNDIARELAETGAPEGTLVTARRQRSGRGRRGNAWESIEGNVFLSLILRPETVPQDAAQVSFVAAVTVGDLVANLLPSCAIRLKWPNDVLCDGNKISGILLEAGPSNAAGLQWLIVGVGINVTAKPRDRSDATSLRDEDARSSDAENVIAGFCDRFLTWYRIWQADGFEPVRDAWLTRAHGLAGPIRINLQSETVDAIFDGVDETGALLAHMADGSSRRVTGGEVHFGRAGA